MFSVVEWNWLDTLSTAVSTADSLNNRSPLPRSFVARHLKNSGMVVTMVFHVISTKRFSNTIFYSLSSLIIVFNVKFRAMFRFRLIF